MSNTFFLPEESDCQYIIKDKTQEWTLDVFDVYTLYIQAKQSAQDVNSNPDGAMDYKDFFINSMYNKFGIKLTKTAATLIITQIIELATELKKKCVQQQSSSDFMDSEDSPSENVISESSTNSSET